MLNDKSDIIYNYFKKIHKLFREMNCAKKKYKYLIEDDRIDMEKVLQNIRYTLGIIVIEIEIT